MVAAGDPTIDRTQLAAKRLPIPFVDLKAQQQHLRGGIDKAIARVLNHGQYIMGPEVFELEKQLAQFCGAKHVLSCSSGTDALAIAMMAKGVGPGDAVLCPAFTYAATPESIAQLGATPVFVDVDDRTFNVDPFGLEAGLAVARKKSLRAVGLIAVDLFGLPADYDSLSTFCRDHNLWILADAAQSFGAAIGGRKVGALGDIAATSFFPAKPLGCYGDGGAMFTGDDAIAGVMTSLRSHGTGEDKYDFQRIGVTGRLDTIQAAILLEKMKIFAGELEQREQIAQRYTGKLASIEITTPVVTKGVKSAWAQYTVRIPGGRRDSVMRFLQAAGVPCMIYYARPLHRQSAYRHFPIAATGLPATERLSDDVLSLPMHPYLSEQDQDYIVEQVLLALF